MAADATWASMKVRHGTHSGWALHQRLGERPCDPCYQAKSEYDARRKTAPVEVSRARAHAAAQGRASKQLRHNHPDEYRQLYEQAKADIASERGEA